MMKIWNWTKVDTLISMSHVSANGTLFDPSFINAPSWYCSGVVTPWKPCQLNTIALWLAQVLHHQREKKKIKQHKNC